MYAPDSVEYQLFKMRLLKSINSRYVCMIISRFKFSYDELEWFAKAFPRQRGLRAGRGKTRRKLLSSGVPEGFI